MFEIMVDRIASGNAIGYAERIASGVQYAHRIASDYESSRNAAVSLENPAQLPASKHRGCRSAERSRWHLPRAVDDQAVRNVVVRDGTADFGIEVEPGRNGVGECIARDR